MTPEVYITDLIIIGLVSGLLHLDRTAAFQFLVSRPIVASVITGILLGQPAAGLGSGLVLELLWLGIHPLGTSIPPDDTIVAVAVPAGAIFAGRAAGAAFSGEPTSILALSILLALPLAALGRWLDIGLRRLNGRFLKTAREGASKGDAKRVGRQIAKSLIMIFLTFTMLSVIGIYVLTALIKFIYPHIGAGVLSALRLVYFAIPFFGAAGILAGLRGKKIFEFSAAFGVTYLLLFIVIGGAL